MKRIIPLIVSFLFLNLSNTHAQNLDRGLYPNLPDPLVTEKGLKVNDISTWETIRRQELINIFTDSIYGRSPQKGDYTCNFKVVNVTPIANGTAVRKMVQFSITGPNGTQVFEVPLYIPKTNKKAPVFILISHRDPIEDTSSTSDHFPLNNLILPRGYAAVVNNAFYYNEENESTYHNGLLDKFNMNGPHDWRSLSARTFVTSRIIDYLETDPDIDASKIAVIGHSRSGKAAMWAGAQDERIALTCPNDAGLGGDKLVRRAQGGLTDKWSPKQSRWYAPKIADFVGRDTSLPFDWHQLASTIAPRLLACGVASKDGNADPVGQFHTLVLTQPVFKLYGKAELKWTVDDAPSTDSTENIVLENGNIHFHQRVGKHDLALYDWEQYLDFADKMLN